jgi:hypothetical protein
MNDADKTALETVIRDKVADEIDAKIAAKKARAAQIKAEIEGDIAKRVKAEADKKTSKKPDDQPEEKTKGKKNDAAEKDASSPDSKAKDSDAKKGKSESTEKSEADATESDAKGKSGKEAKDDKKAKLDDGESTTKDEKSKEKSDDEDSEKSAEKSKAKRKNKARRNSTLAPGAKTLGPGAKTMGPGKKGRRAPRPRQKSEMDLRIEEEKALIDTKMRKRNRIVYAAISVVTLLLAAWVILRGGEPPPRTHNTTAPNQSVKMTANPTASNTGSKTSFVPSAQRSPSFRGVSKEVEKLVAAKDYNGAVQRLKDHMAESPQDTKLCEDRIKLITDSYLSGGGDTWKKMSNDEVFPGGRKSKRKWNQWEPDDVDDLTINDALRMTTRGNDRDDEDEIFDTTRIDPDKLRARDFNLDPTADDDPTPAANGDDVPPPDANGLEELDIGLPGEGKKDDAADKPKVNKADKAAPAAEDLFF